MHLQRSPTVHCALSAADINDNLNNRGLSIACLHPCAYLTTQTRLYIATKLTRLARQMAEIKVMNVVPPTECNVTCLCIVQLTFLLLYIVNAISSN